MFGLSTIRSIKLFLLTASFVLRDRQDSIRYSGDFVIGSYSGVCFHIFYCNSPGLSAVFRFNGVFVVAVFHSIVWHSLSYKEDTKFPNISLCLKR